MERLTTNLNETTHRCAKVSTELCYGQEDCYTCHQYKQIIDRLAAYEDTGLRPEEIVRLVAMEKRGRMAKMLRWEEAEQDGRLEVLPCKVGDTVYAAETAPVIPLTVSYAGVRLDGADGGDWESLKNFGKTVFLTREEAEAALKGGTE